MTEWAVGPGIKAAMDDHGDEPRSNETFENPEGERISTAYGRDAIYHWLEVDNAVRRVPFR
jgi:hypothetical protein